MLTSNLNFLSHFHVNEVHQTHGISHFQLELALKTQYFLSILSIPSSSEGRQEVGRGDSVRGDRKCPDGPSLMTGSSSFPAAPGHSSKAEV